MTSHPQGNDMPLRFGLIGCAAGIAATHLEALGRLEGARIVGMSDVAAERGAARAAEHDCPFFTDHREMLAQTSPDVAVVLTPHPFHAPIALDCFEAGAHVLVEKPIAVEIAEADQMIAAAEAAGKLLAVNFQHRYRPAIEGARALIDEGVIGNVVRVLWIEPWFRTEAYYRSASWRGTWKGEGGGVLMNQAPHTLDLLCYLVGLPAKVWGWTRTLRHSMECEDSAQAMFELPNGSPGYFATNTIEAGRGGHFEIIGERASLLIEGTRLTLTRFEPDSHEFMMTSQEMFASPKAEVETIEFSGMGDGHLAVYRDLQDAIRTGKTPRTAGQDAAQALEFANAIVLSSYRDGPVTLPLDRGAYSELLRSLRAGTPPATGQATP
jgi:UDP-N-acetyl-2-amino-2-deoxyglucuronate dehydrogenase